jgi:hypothetical protein
LTQGNCLPEASACEPGQLGLRHHPEDAAAGVRGQQFGESLAALGILNADYGSQDHLDRDCAHAWQQLELLAAGPTPHLFCRDLLDDAFVMLDGIAVKRRQEQTPRAEVLRSVQQHDTVWPGHSERLGVGFAGSEDFAFAGEHVSGQVRVEDADDVAEADDFDREHLLVGISPEAEFAERVHPEDRPRRQHDPWETYSSW